MDAGKSRNDSDSHTPRASVEAQDRDLDSYHTSVMPLDQTTQFPPPLLPVSPHLLKRYDRKAIYERVWQIPIWRLAKELGVTEHALCNACIKLYIPTPPRGFWSMKESNRKRIERPPLCNVAALVRFAPATQESNDPALYVSALLMSRHNRQKLYEEVWSMPLGQVSALYGVTDTSIFYRCKNLHIPTPGPEYWQKKELGRVLPDRPALPAVIVKGVTRNTKTWEERKAALGKRNDRSQCRPSRRRPDSE